MLGVRQRLLLGSAVAVVLVAPISVSSGMWSRGASVSDFIVDIAPEKGSPPNSALDLTVRPVTPVAETQRARQSGPQVSAGVRLP